MLNYAFCKVLSKSLYVPEKRELKNSDVVELLDVKSASQTPGFGTIEVRDETCR